MAFRPRLVVLALSLGSAAAAAAACASSDDAADSGDSAITGTVSEARACSVRDAYAAARLDAFKDVTLDELPAPLRVRLWNDGVAHLKSLVKFDVAGVGTVFVVELESGMTFYAGNATAIVVADTAGRDSTWLTPSGEPLVCSDGAAPVDVDATSPDASSDGG